MLSLLSASVFFSFLISRDNKLVRSEFAAVMHRYSDSIHCWSLQIVRWHGQSWIQQVLLQYTTISQPSHFIMSAFGKTSWHRMQRCILLIPLASYFLVARQSQHCLVSRCKQLINPLSVSRSRLYLSAFSRLSTRVLVPNWFMKLNNGQA